MTQETRSLVHLVGSFPCRNAQEVFDHCGRELAGHVKRVPDGEVHGWINFSISSLAAAKGLERASEEEVYAPAYATPAQLREYHERAQTRKRLTPKLRVRPGLAASDIEFAPLGYDRIALASYDLFKQAQAAGHLPRTTRFQVGLPTAFATLASVLGADDVHLALPKFEQTLFREVEAITRAIPHAELAIQWDVAVEVVAVLERMAPPLASRFSSQDLAAALARACEQVPPAVETGVHLCYGNPGGKHIVEPGDTAVMVAFANEFLGVVNRSIEWIHVPVPINRDDDAYFAPLEKLRLHPGTELFLGLVHPQDGLEGAQRRITAARRFAPSFGVGTECGMRFFPAETLPELLALHREAAQANAAAD